jgi:glutamate-ammonia-ligase adenylyltransferase
MGFVQPAQASEAIRAWHHGRIRATHTARGRELFTRLAPRLLEAVRRTGAPDVAFSRFARFFSGLSAGVQVQSLLLAEPEVLEQLVEVLAFAPDLARTLSRFPTALDALLDARFREPIGMAGAGEAVRAGVGEEHGLEPAMSAARRIAREQRFRIGLQILTGKADPAAAGAAYTDLAEACLTVLAPRVLAEVECRAGAFSGAAAVAALGKAGSREMTARSDLDLMVIYEAEPGALSADKGWRAETVYGRFAQQLISALSAQTSEGALYDVDLRLRPSGADGPLAVSLAALEEYYGVQAETWELMALTRARVVWASEARFADRVAGVIEGALRRPREIPAMAADCASMRRLLELERPAAGPWDLKLVPGGLVDIEFATQLAQLAHAAGGGPLRPGVAEALDAAAGRGFVTMGQNEVLARAWRLQTALAQLTAALDEGVNPSAEPKPFKRKLALAGGARSFSALEAKLKRTQAQARRAYLSVVRATETTA